MLHGTIFKISQDCRGLSCVAGQSDNFFLQFSLPSTENKTQNRPSCSPCRFQPGILCRCIDAHKKVSDQLYNRQMLFSNFRSFIPSPRVSKFSLLHNACLRTLLYLPGQGRYISTETNLILFAIF